MMTKTESAFSVSASSEVEKTWSVSKLWYQSKFK